jgi:hypothetical protein
MTRRLFTIVCAGAWAHALKLPLGPSGNPRVVLTLEGTVVKDTASGRAIDTTGQGTFRLVRKA